MAMPERAILQEHPAKAPAAACSSQALLSIQERVIRAAVRGRDSGSTFELVMNALSQAVSSDCGMLLSWVVGEQNLQVTALSGSHQLGLRPGMSLPLSKPLPDLASGRLAATICSDTHNDGNWLNRTMGQRGIGSTLTIPLDTASAVRKLLLIGSINKGHFSPGDAAVVEQLTGVLRTCLQDCHQGNGQKTEEQWGRGQAGVSEHYRLVSELSQGVAHRLGNIFGVLLGRLQLLEDNVNDQATIAQLKELQATVTEGTTLLQSLARFSARVPADDRQRVNLRILAEEVIELTRPVWDLPDLDARDIKLVHHGADDIEVYANRTELKEALVNMIFNAIQALPNGGEIVIAQGRDKELGFVQVADTGVGMDSEVRRRATEPFFSTREGTCPGLGLSLANRIARKHNGYISIFSAPGEGSVIRLFVALSPE